MRISSKISFLISCLFFITISCTSTNYLEDSKRIYIGMSIDSFCDAVLTTWINEDPCLGGQVYYSSNNTIILFAENATRYYVFDSVIKPNKKSGKLALITSSFSEAEFFLGNLK